MSFRMFKQDSCRFHVDLRYLYNLSGNQPANFQSEHFINAYAVRQAEEYLEGVHLFYRANSCVDIGWTQKKLKICFMTDTW